MVRFGPILPERRKVGHRGVHTIGGSVPDIYLTRSDV